MGAPKNNSKAAKAAAALVADKKKKNATRKGPSAARPLKKTSASRAARQKGAARAVVCLGCINSGLQTKSSVRWELALTPEQEAQAARVEELVGVIAGALVDPVREVLGLPVA
ncbi:hypothetical protein IFR05_015671 [Cadophora sp. M221]|nr:hypothetical protein IFR05_015671 [Cadophora sp. M221]